ncbi:hypothetical protein BP5796_11067 [Coleophoma crateriformis]|uniref:Uncharacterized protein n=1 Tax=Coleophoma crateriformis TaxID=565419 RepID=A0A3D8QLU4_9HELO|nr:hypothetical protein BP5796_11067 [Coleophoma crateriformis]
MASTTAIPRFLLPQRGAIWRARLPTPATFMRQYSSKVKPKKPSSPLVLEKPAKFNPPSHGARLRKEGPRYPGPDLSAEEKARQQKTKYPNMMPPEGTFMHWFINNRSIHMIISIGTLTSLAFTVFITNFKRESPYADMLPHWTQFFAHPIQSGRTCIEILKLHTAYMTAETQARRTRKVEDVAKRGQYRKAHGLDQDEGFGGWTAKTDAELQGPAIPLGDGIAEPTEQQQQVRREKVHVKKWFGIW